MADSSNIEEILKVISAFDVDSDFDNKESKEALSAEFNKLIMSNEPMAKEFFGVFLDGISDVLDSMGVVEDESEEEEAPTTDNEEAQESPTEESPEEESPVEDEEEPTIDDVPEEMMSAGRVYVRPLIEQANRYIYE